MIFNTITSLVIFAFLMKKMDVTLSESEETEETENDTVWQNKKFGNQTFNAFGHNYCLSNCTALLNNRHPMACHCKNRTPMHLEYMDNWLEFRKRIVNTHNNFRGNVAAGKTLLPEAANMLVMNYDLEMEYLARCFARVFYLMKLFGDLNCTETKEGVKSGVSVYSIYEYKFMEDWFADMVKMIDKMKINSFVIYPNEAVNRKSLEKLVRLLWWSNVYVGCARVKNADMTFGILVICYYRGEKDSGNIEGEPVYKVGNSCTACPDQTKCVSEGYSITGSPYSFLCGTINPIPKEIEDLPRFSGFNSTPTNIFNTNACPKPHNLQFSTIVILMFIIKKLH